MGWVVSGDSLVNWLQVSGSDEPGASAPAWVSYAALAVSILAILSSFGLGVFTWLKAGPAVRVHGDTRPPLLQTGRRRPVRSAARLTVLTITVKNTGRAPAKVHRFWLASSRTVRTSVQVMEHSDPTSVTIPPGDIVRWYISIDALRVMTKRLGNDLRLWPEVEWGIGKIATGRGLRMHVSPPPQPRAGTHVITLSTIVEDSGWTPAESTAQKMWRKLRRRDQEAAD